MTKSSRPRTSSGRSSAPSARIVDLDAVEEPHLGHLTPRGLHRVGLLEEAIVPEPVGVPGGLRVVRQPQEAEPGVARGLEHLEDRGRPVAPVGVDVEDTTESLELDQVLGNHRRRAFAQLGRDRLHAERAVDLILRPGRRAGRRELRLRAGELHQPGDVRLVRPAGERGVDPFARRDETDVHRDPFDRRRQRFVARGHDVGDRPVVRDLELGERLVLGDAADDHPYILDDLDPATRLAERDGLLGPEQVGDLADHRSRLRQQQPLRPGDRGELELHPLKDLVLLLLPEAGHRRERALLACRLELLERLDARLGEEPAHGLGAEPGDAEHREQRHGHEGTRAIERVEGPAVEEVEDLLGDRRSNTVELLQRVTAAPRGDVRQPVARLARQLGKVAVGAQLERVLSAQLEEVGELVEGARYLWVLHGRSPTC